MLMSHYQNAVAEVASRWYYSCKIKVPSRWHHNLKWLKCRPLQCCVCCYCVL